MRILTLSNLYPPYYIGGYELNCHITVEAMRRRGHDVQVLTSNHGVTTDGPTEAEPHIERSLRIHGYYGHPWLNIVGLRKLELHNNAVLRRAISAFKPDLVHVWNTGGISKSLLLTLEELGVPTALYVSDHWIARSLKADVWMDWWNRKAMSLPARLLRFAWTALGLRRRWRAIAPTGSVFDAKFHRLTFCSRALRELTSSQGYEVAHAAIIHCPVNTERFTGEPVAAEQPMRRLLYVGRLAEDKGVMTALKAMAQFKGRFDGELRIYGKGDADYTSQLHAFVREHAVPATFHSASASEMPEVYRAHDALLFTSEWEEPFALTPLEAMASGLPVIGTTTGGSAELFRDGVNALTYSAGDAGMLASQILLLANDAELRASIAAQGQRNVREKCAESIIMDQIESYLTETVERWNEWSAPQQRGSSQTRARDVLPELSPVTA